MRVFPLFIITFSLLLFFNSGCKKPEDIGLAILPQSDLLNATHIDTLTLQTITLREDSLQGNLLSRLLLGSYLDPDFGLSQTGIYAQVLLSVTPILGASGDVLTADSVVLSLVYAGFYGDTSSQSQQVVHVYKMTQDMNVDSTYYTNATFNDSSSFDFANSFKFQPHTTDSITVDTLKQPAQLRITLDKSFASTLVGLNGSTYYQSNDNWTPFFKGFHIVVDAATVPNTGAILYFDPANPYTKMTLYYHDSSSAGNVAKTFDFLFVGARVNHEEHNYTGSGAGNQVITPTVNDSVNYLQSMAGLKVKLTIPYLSHLKDSGNVIINKAELVIKAEPNTANMFAVPTDLFLSAFDSTGKINLLTDYFAGNFGGSFNVSDNTYRFNVSRQIQQILDGKISNYGFSLNVLSSSVQANRVIIGSGKSIASKMKLNLYYTKLKK